jgi:kynureninase
VNPEPDLFSRTRECFHIPEGLVYLDGNSLGPLPLAARERVLTELELNWGEKLIGAWEDAGWIDLAQAAGDRIAALVGAPDGSIVAGDSTSVNLFKVLSAALQMRPERRAVLSDTGDFPTDLYVAQGLTRALADGHELRLVPPEDVQDALDESVAVVSLTHIDYRTGRMHDMEALTRRAHEVGALTVWDLAHSAGAVPVDLTATRADFAVGCGYKYLNGGPGAPAFAYVRPDLADSATPALIGWLGHDAPFDFEPEYRPAPGVGRMVVGTPPILSMACLHEALAVWDGVDMHAVRERSIQLSELFVAEVQARCPELALASPRDPEQRGSHVSFRHPEGYAIVQALISRGVVGDFRTPDMMRFGFAPLYVSPDDVHRAAVGLATVIRERLWDDPVFARKGKVT